MAIYTTIQPVEERHSGLFFEDSAIVLREEQEEAIDKAFKYFKKKSNNKYLWNAKMRFGKTFTSYQLAKKMGWKRILILTFKPAVQNAWEEDLNTHIDFEGWQFVCNRGKNDDECLLEVEHLDETDRGGIGSTGKQ